MPGRGRNPKLPPRPLPVSRVTRAQRAKFLELTRDGKRRDVAAREVKLTGRAFRALCNPLAHNYDPAFATAYQAALEDGNQAVVEALHDAQLTAALDPEHAAFSRANHYALLHRDPDYRSAHQRTLAAGAKVGADGTVEILLAFQDTDGDG